MNICSIIIEKININENIKIKTKVTFMHINTYIQNEMKNELAL